MKYPEYHKVIYPGKWRQNGSMSQDSLNLVVVHDGIQLAESAESHCHDVTLYGVIVNPVLTDYILFTLRKPRSPLRRTRFS